MVSGCHQVTCTSHHTWRLPHQVVWYLFRPRSWPTPRPWLRRRSSTSIRTLPRRPPPIRGRRTISPRPILIPAQPLLVCVWKVSRARTATGWYTTTSSTTAAALRCWHTNDWRKLSCRHFCRPCYVATVEICSKERKRKKENEKRGKEKKERKPNALEQRGIGCGVLWEWWDQVRDECSSFIIIIFKFEIIFSFRSYVFLGYAKEKGYKREVDRLIDVHREFSLILESVLARKFYYTWSHH